MDLAPKKGVLRLYWADRVAKEIIDSGKYKPYWVDDMFTPSGFAHIGSLRGPLVHDLIYKALEHLNEEATFSFIINDFDAIDGLPDDLKEKFSDYMGVPLKNAPSPVEGFKCFADYFADDFKNVLTSLGVTPNYYSSWDLYHEGKFDEVIKEALDNAEKIQDIYQRISGSKKKEIEWLPFQVICENCGKLGTTRVHDWDGKTVAYKCEPEMVKWAKGCGNEGRISPFGGTGKLPWKVDWPAHWKVLGVTIEGAGKDHSSAGGSRDIAREECKEVFQIEEPYNLPYEFFLIGGKKMGSSKGLGLKAKDAKDLLPPELARFLFSRTDYKQAVEFDPIATMAIPDLFDEYDRCYKAYIDSSDETLSRAFEMAQISMLSDVKPEILPRFRDVVNYMQMANIDILKKYEELKKSPLSDIEKNILEERVEYAKVWLEKYAPDEFKIAMIGELPEMVKDLTGDQKKFLLEAVNLIKENENPESLQLALYNLTKELKFDAKKSFSAIYISLIGKQFGPKAAWFILSYPKEDVIKRFEEASK